MNHYDWAEQFRQCYDKAVTAYKAGNRQPATYFNPGETAFLAGIGCTPQEVYDFAEDWCGAQEPALATVLLITAARRDYFQTIQQGQPAGPAIAMGDLPAKDAAVADAYATAIGNLVKTPADIEPALDYGAAQPGVDGVVIIIGDRVGFRGRIKLV